MRAGSCVHTVLDLAQIPSPALRSAPSGVGLFADVMRRRTGPLPAFGGEPLIVGLSTDRLRRQTGPPRRAEADRHDDPAPRQAPLNRARVSGNSLTHIHVPGALLSPGARG